MKKYITLAALLTAGAAFANAGEKTLETTFSNVAQEQATSVALTNAWGGEASGSSPVSAYVTELESFSGSELSLFTSGSAGEDATAFAPNQNVSRSGWTANFLYTPKISALGQIGQITLNVGYFLPATGNWYNTTWYSAGDIDFTATVKDASGKETLGSFTGTLTESSLPSSGDLSSLSVVLTGSSVVSLGSLNDECVQVTIATEMTESSTSANGVALRSIKFSSIPEPSTFGLLAGLGAIALVGTRRRRR